MSVPKKQCIQRIQQNVFRLMVYLEKFVHWETDGSVKSVVLKMKEFEPQKKRHAKNILPISAKQSSTESRKTQSFTLENC